MLRWIAAAIFLWSQTAAATEIHFVVISGIGGETEYSRLFSAWSLDLLDAAEHELGVSPARTTYLAHRPQMDPARTDGVSRKEDIIRALADVGSRVGEGDLIALFLIGHGSLQNGAPQFNIPGPDLTATELAEALDSLKDPTILVVNSSASSGPFLPVLSGPNRIVITATQSAEENNHTVFANHLAAALATDSADTDKDGRTSVLEAFEYARHEVEREYRSDRRLLTEHAMLDDDGDGEGTLNPGSDGDDGALARVTYLESRRAPALANETVRRELTRLRARSDEIEQRLDELRGEKERLDPSVYDERLEELLVELTLNRRALQAAEAGE
jgi:hypothetical protein